MDLSIIKKAIGNFKAIHGRAPTPAEMAQLESQAARFVQPTSGLRTGMSAQPRAAYELATDPNLINPDTARDPFLTKMLTGRTPKGTNLKPYAQDITDPQVMKNIEAKQMADELPLGSQGSVTPSADYLAQQAQAVENEALSGGALDKLKEGFYKNQGRYPDEDELNAIVAEFNPARHQYGEQGVGIISQRPPTAKGMTDWRNAARAEGIPESYLHLRKGNYPQYLQDELTLQRGEIPTTGIGEAKKKLPPSVEPKDFYIDEHGRLVKVYPTMKAAGGQITPQDMLAEMLVNKVTPQKFAKGAAVKNIATNAGISAMMDPAYLVNAAKQAGHQFRTGKVGSGLNTVTDIASSVSPYFLVPAIYQAGRGMAGVASEQLARNPVQRKQMQSMASTPLGGAFGGDDALAAAILGNQDYEGVLAERNADEIAAMEQAKEAERQAYRQKLYRESPVVLKDETEYTPIQQRNALGY